VHAQCRGCGAVYDLPPDLLDDVAATLSARHHFVLDAGHVALSGLCAACAGAGPVRGHAAPTGAVGEAARHG
jgi:Fur family ferric uptake transcriptional regulator